MLGKYYHENHFCCCVCKLPIGQEQFKVHEEEAYCQEDYLKKFGKRCSGCSQFLQGEYINALGQMWHKQCFHCTVSIWIYLPQKRKGTHCLYRIVNKVSRVLSW